VKTNKTNGKKGALTTAKKKFAVKNKDVSFTIKMKDEEGKVVEFESEEVVPVVKKKKFKSKTVRPSAEMAIVRVGATAFDAEDTLAMIKSALKSGSADTDGVEGIRQAKKQKKVVKKKEKVPELEENEILEGVEDEEDFREAGDLESVDALNLKAGGKKAKKAKKGKKKAKEPLDSISRFFNDYGESPHLQAIEMSYLKYLEAQYAKESHLKAVKRMQILRALKTI